MLLIKIGRFSGLTPASTFAGDWSFGSANMDITDINILSTVCMGNQRSDAFSYPHLSSPGSCKIEIHTFPSLSTEKAKSHFFRIVALKRGMGQKFVYS